MIYIPFIPTEIVFAAVWVIIRAVLALKNKKLHIKRELMLLLMYVNLAVLLRITFFPMQTNNGRVLPLEFDTANIFPLRINIIPFVNILDYIDPADILLNIPGNVMMFIPSGIILPILYKRLNSFWKVTAAGAGMSLCIEILQLPFAVRASDVDDLILNTAGAMAGYGIYALFRHIRHGGNKKIISTAQEG
ncbi:MAG: VanZ family protein [Ruminococcus sp.]|uniref:VanZ family protein n=1 Tax=Ruminococcus sp. TaxID=41978 RepID=UPI0025FC4C90|nr:VanZ family protein [Ruminococcus sp.]MCR5539708.1 VanZ family protein [Ruminococcus sp.]